VKTGNRRENKYHAQNGCHMTCAEWMSHDKSKKQYIVINEKKARFSGLLLSHFRVMCCYVW